MPATYTLITLASACSDVVNVHPQGQGALAHERSMSDLTSTLVEGGAIVVSQAQN